MVIYTLSGACFSGKTTVIEELNNLIKNNNGNKFVKDNARDIIKNYFNDISITELRRNPQNVLLFQELLFKTKMQLLDNILRKKYRLVIIDRDLVDQLYYFNLYFDNLNNIQSEDINLIFLFDLFDYKEANKKDVISLKNKLINEIKNDDKYGIKHILFKPIVLSTIYQNVDNFNDKHRVVDDIKSNKHYIEYKRIRNLLFSIKNIKTKRDIVKNDIKILRHNIQYKNPLFDFLKAIKRNYYFKLLYNQLDYFDYSKIEKEDYLLENELMNSLYAIDLPADFDYLRNVGNNVIWMLFSSLLFLDNKTIEKSRYLEIKDKIANLKTKIDADFLDSLCLPNGLLFKGNDIMLGLNPGKFGRGLEKDYFKPSFIFTRTSYIFRQIILKLLKDKKLKTIPYITNLVKYATYNNKITIDDVNNSADILCDEIKLIEPKNIYCFGKETFDYMNNVILNKLQKDLVCEINLIKTNHPTYFIYKNIKLDEIKI